MKNLAEFKKRLKVGAKLQATHHLTFAGRNEKNEPIFKDFDLGIREVSIVQSNSFALKTNKKEPGSEFIEKSVDSWCSYPKASECFFTGNDTITILETQTQKKVLTYTFIN